jgi:signal transduction histidine kinase/ligand-binding sensor domain-containing protein
MCYTKLIRVYVLNLAIVFISVSSFAQSENIEFDRYTINSGLSSGYVNSIFQDSEGFIWIATSNGLNRFDGITFKSYYFDVKDSTSIPGNNVSYITEDSLGKIWVMTNRNFCVYDRSKDCFARKQLKIDGRKISELGIYNCLIDSKGFLWIGSSSGIFRFKLYDNSGLSGSTIDGENFLLDDGDRDNLYKNLNTSFVEDDSGKLWVTSNSSNLFYFDKRQNKFIAQSINYPEAHNFSNKNKGFFKDSNGDFFITIENMGLLVWDRHKNMFRFYKPDGSDNGPKGNILYALAEDKNGLIWIGDRNTEGVSIFNKKTGKFIYCQSEELNPYSLSTNKITSIYRDKTGSMWVGTIVGLNKYSPGKLKFNRYFRNPNLPDKLSFNNILCFTQSHTGDIWVGTDGGGLNKLNRGKDTFTHYKKDPTDPNSLKSNAIISLCEDHEGTLWIGTYDGGLARMKGDKFYSFLPDESSPNSISNKNIWYVIEDSKKNLWVATLTSGLDLLDRKTGRFYHYTKRGNDSTSICDNSLVSLYEDSRHNLYISSYNGVSIVNLNSYDFSKLPPDIKFRNLVHYENRNSISSNAVYCVKEDKKGNIWFGTMGSGIDELDLATGKFTNYSIKDGLPGNSVHSILVDDSDNLWLGTDKGLVRFNPETKEINVFDMEDGLLNLSFKSWAIKTTDGEMFFGGPDGFNSFYPERVELNRNKNKPKVVITGFKIFNKPVKINEKFNGKVILTRSISETHELQLTYRENFFTFEFIALDYTAPKKNNYSYMMERFDNEWINCGTKREANYTNLDPGKYTFRVKALNNDGVSSDKDTFIRIVILPPWWSTWWFRILLLISVILLFTYILVSRVRNLKNQKIQLEIKVAKKTAELNELNISKDKFFSIIAHDLKNPFSSIIGLSEIMKEEIRESDRNTLENYAVMINNSAVQTFRLLENLLEWANSQRGKILFDPKPFSLNEVLDEEFLILNDLALKKNIELKNKLGNDLTIFADKNMIKTVLRNLISNAIKFTSKNGEVNINASCVDKNVEISVSDNGIGMTKDIVAKLFRLDANLSTRGTENEKGTGLGLFLCKEFTYKHNGKILVESEPGKGSVFRLILPSA